MKMFSTVVLLTASFDASLIEAAVLTKRQIPLLELQRTSTSRPPLFSDDHSQHTLNLQGFCKRPDCQGPFCEPVCTSQPCCCWSTFAEDKHPTYPNPTETELERKCLYPPEGFIYAPEPGLSFDAGYADFVSAGGLPQYPGRRLCCLRRDDGVKAESQQDLIDAVPTQTTTTTTATTTGDPQPPIQFTTKTFTTTFMMPGDEYENAQMEDAAREHLATATALKSSVASLYASADSLRYVQHQLQTDTTLLHKQARMANLHAALSDWETTRKDALQRIAAGVASADANATIATSSRWVPITPPPQQRPKQLKTSNDIGLGISPGQSQLKMAPTDKQKMQILEAKQGAPPLK